MITNTRQFQLRCPQLLPFFRLHKPALSRQLGSTLQYGIDRFGPLLKWSCCQVYGQREAPLVLTGAPLKFSFIGAIRQVQTRGLDWGESHRPVPKLPFRMPLRIDCTSIVHRATNLARLGLASRVVHAPLLQLRLFLVRSMTRVFSLESLRGLAGTTFVHLPAFCVSHLLCLPLSLLDAFLNSPVVNSSFLHPSSLCSVVGSLLTIVSTRFPS